MIIPQADRLQNVAEYYFSRKLERIQQLRSEGVDVINLGIGSPDLAPPSTVRDAAAEALMREDTHGYAPYRSIPELRKAMAEWYQRTYHVKLDPEREVLPLIGSKEGILAISLAFLNPGDAALVPDPGYPAYSSVTSLVGGRALRYDLTEESDWLPDFEALERMDLSRCKLMWVNYPNMPTGRPATAELFGRLAEFGRRHRILICHDNPYGLVLNSEEPKSILSHDPAMSSVLELNSMSKSFNMAGWRVGMLLGSSQVVDSVLQVKSNIDSGIFLAIQKGASHALQVDRAWHEARNQIYRERRREVWSLFDRLGFSYERQQEGLFVWAKAPDGITDVGEFVDGLLEESGVFLTPGFVFGSNGKRFARASLCLPKNRIAEAAQRVKRVSS